MIDTRAILEHAEDCPKHRYNLLKEVCDAYDALVAVIRNSAENAEHTVRCIEKGWQQREDG